MPVPDADIHPHATGAAAKLVAAHQAPSELKFYSGWFCPFVQRTWIALEEKGVGYQYVEINPYHKDPDYLKINPKGLVPAIEYKGKMLAESNILVEFLDDAFPNTRPLLPSDAGARAVVRMQIDLIAKRIVPASFRCIMAQEEGEQASARAEYCKAVRELMQAVKADEGASFLGGEKINAADISLAPWSHRALYIEEERGGPFTEQEIGSTYVAWRKAIAAHPAVQATLSERQHYDPIYGRYLRNEAQSDAAKATRSGRHIP